MSTQPSTTTATSGSAGGQDQVQQPQPVVPDNTVAPPDTGVALGGVVSASNIHLHQLPSFVDPIAASALLRDQHATKYAQLLAIAEDIGKDIRPSYASNKQASERLRRNIAFGRTLVRECMLEVDRAGRK